MRKTASWVPEAQRRYRELVQACLSFSGSVPKSSRWASHFFRIGFTAPQLETAPGLKDDRTGPKDIRRPKEGRENPPALSVAGPRVLTAVPWKLASKVVETCMVLSVPLSHRYEVRAVALSPSKRCRNLFVAGSGRSGFQPRQSPSWRGEERFCVQR